MKVVLAEKPSVARDIAKCLGARDKKNGYFEGNDWAVTWAFGHMVELENPDGYNKEWKRWSLHTLPMIPAEFKVKAREDDSQKQLAIINELFQKADELICATDAGREGELIFRYIQTWTGTEDKPFKRLWISSLTDEALDKGFKGLKEGHDFDPLYRAARCRSEADWIVGLNATRFFTVKYGRDKELWTVGRVQTPVLAMIVARDLDIEKHNASDYWELHTLYREVDFKCDAGKIEKKEEGDALLEKVKGGPLVITDIREQRKSFNPPLLYDLTELQRDMNKRWGYTADQTLKLAQQLYERKHLTYPRTDSRYLSTDIEPELPGLLKMLANKKAKSIGALDLENLKITKRIVDNSKVSDHHAIIPTKQLPGDLGVDLAKVYDAVLMRFIAVFYPVCIKAVTTVFAESAGEKFRASGTVVVEAGWQGLFPNMNKDKKKESKKKKGKEEDSDDEKEDESQELPTFEKGEQGDHEPFLKTLKTKPPRAYNEASLLQAMETAGKTVSDEELREALKEKGIGTPATRASIIEVLLRRKYIKRVKKNLVSLDAGRELIRLVQDEQLKSPELTGEWEAKLKQIEQGKYAPEDFMAQVVAHTESIISQSGEVKRGPRHIADCPKCDGHLMEGKKGYGCTRWKSGCEFVIWKDQFGHKLKVSELMELVEKKKLKNPILIRDEDKLFYARLKMSMQGEIAYDRVTGKVKIGDRALMGVCPTCGSDVIEGPKGYGCVDWKNGCKFVVWKNMGNRTIPKDMVRVLLKEGITPFIQKFKKRDGTRFDARLKLEGGEVNFNFTPNPPKEKPEGEVEEKRVVEVDPNAVIDDTGVIDQ